MAARDSIFGTRATLSSEDMTCAYYRLQALADHGIANVGRLPHTMKIFLENVLRCYDGQGVTEEDVLALAKWDPANPAPAEVPFLPARVLLQDFTGVPAVVDLAAMRSAVARVGGDPQRINPLVPVDLVIDHSVQVDHFGTALAPRVNAAREYERNGERYTLLRWAQKAFQNFRVVPPSTGIVHQVNLEYLSHVVQTWQVDGETVACPDTLVGTDSHTTMVNGLGVLGWGVGGIEAEAVMLGQPLYLLAPFVVGVHLMGELPAGTTATDLVLTLTQMLRQHGVVGEFVEFYGAGLSRLSLADRATLANMAPEYGATAALFPVDDETLRYLRMTARPESTVELVERYTKEQGLFRTDESPDPHFSERLALDLASVVPSLAGPKRPQDRVPLSQVRQSFRQAFPTQFAAPEPKSNKEDKERFDWEGGVADESQAEDTAETAVERRPALLPRLMAEAIGKRVAVAERRQRTVEVEYRGAKTELSDGSVVIAAITSCTNTSNPAVMLGAGLLARKAVELGLSTRPYVKTSLAPGSRVVTDYLRQAGLLPYLEALGFHLVGYGCTTCIGNSGPLPEPIGEAIRDQNLVVASVLSGNRNFEGRIHPLVRASYLASPPLVVAYALAGTVDIDLTRDPLGHDANGETVFLADIWPMPEEVQEAMESVVRPELFKQAYEKVFVGDETWRSLPVPEASQFAWDSESTYSQEPPFFTDMSPEPAPLRDIVGARVLVLLGDSITTDHISPAGSIPVDSPAGQYLIERNVEPRDFNTYGARRGNHEVMVRGTFGNVRLRNELVREQEGDWTVHHPSSEVVRIFEAAQRYIQAGTPLLVIAGKEYGSGSSRDWAAKGTLLLGVRAVLAESWERIHRSNLIGMGVLPLQFKPGDSRAVLGLDGTETYDVVGIGDGLLTREELAVRARRADGSELEFGVIARLDGSIDVAYLQHGGILSLVLRKLARSKAKTAAEQ